MQNTGQNGNQTEDAKVKIQFKTHGRPAVTTVTTAVSQLVTSSMVQKTIVGEEVHPPNSSSTVVTTMSSTIMSTTLMNQTHGAPEQNQTELHQFTDSL